MNKPAGTEDRRINLKVSEDLHTALKMEAARQRTTLQKLVERLLRQALENPK